LKATAAKEQKYRHCRNHWSMCSAVFNLLKFDRITKKKQSCGGSSHWLENTTNSNRQKYFHWVGILFQGDIRVFLTYQLCLRMSVFN